MAVAEDTYEANGEGEMRTYDKPLNEQIAKLLKEQTYDERREMAQWFRDAVADRDEAEPMDADWFAFTIGSWADNELPDEEADE